VRATSLPTALPVAAAALALVAAAFAPLAVPSPALAERWLRPVPGEVARSFSYSRAAPFAAGAHRGADLAAPAGSAVRAACSGRVVHAGAVAGHGNVVSVRCGAWRVSYLPLARIATRAGAAVRAGARIGTVAPGHGGLHLGVRREGDPFGYEDPIARLAPPERPFAPLPRSRAPRTGAPHRVGPRLVAPQPARRYAPQPARRFAPHPVAPRLAPQPARRFAPHPTRRRFAPHPTRRRFAPHPTRRRFAPRQVARHPVGRHPVARHPVAPRPHPPAAPAPPAPWPVWAGLALLLCGAAGSGSMALRRRRRAHSRASATAPA
jgi:hypothetical protein